MTNDMPLSLAAGYLYWGAKIPLMNTDASFNIKGESSLGSPLRGLARYTYSLGVAILGPCGALYHLLAAAKCRIQAMGTEDASRFEQLKTRSWQHLTVSWYDIRATGSTLVGLVLGVMTVASVLVPVTTGTIPWSLWLVTGAIHIRNLAFKPFVDLLPYRYAYTPLAFAGCMMKTNNAAGVSQSARYQTHFIYQTWVKTNLAVNRELTDEEIKALIDALEQIKKIDVLKAFRPIEMTCIIGQFLVDHQLNKDSQFADRVTFWQSKRKETNSMWSTALMLEAISPDNTGSDSVQLMNKVLERISPRLEELYKGEPLPAMPVQ